MGLDMRGGGVIRFWYMDMPEGYKKLKDYEDEFLCDEYIHHGLGTTLKQVAELMKEMAEALEYASHDCLSPTTETCGVNTCVDRLALLKRFKEWK